MTQAVDPGDFLATMAAASHARVTLAQAEVDAATLRTQADEARRAPPLNLSSRRFDLIAEVKFRSPAAGRLREGNAEAVLARVAGYAESGAAAVSVLTEPTRFDGSLDHLRTAAHALGGRIPAMRKDFLVDPYQVDEARVAGAGGVLLIVRMLDDAALAALVERSLALRMFVLLEAFDEADIARMHACVDRYRRDGQLLVGLNCRDLVTLKVVPGRLEQLVKSLPDEVPRVAESGVANAADAGRLAVAGYDVALVGSALMEALEPLELVRSMLASGRRERAQRS